ncbi:hypothetical protein BC629DRAFT_516029 [Irpex lacteus]|nr:hypothetical protein BC629DRAFT_516029 [Irpex lacteus]
MSTILQRGRDTYEQDSPSSRKKQRLSSPTYDEQFELSQDQIKAFDEFERALTQRCPSPSPKSPLKPSQAITPRSRRRRNIAIALALKENVPKDGETIAVDAKSREGSRSLKSRTTKTSGFQSASSIPTPLQQTEPPHHPPPPKYAGFASASALAAEKSSPTPSPEAPPEPDLAAWFASSDVPAVGFASARALVDASVSNGDGNGKGEGDEDEDEWFSAPAPVGAGGFKSAKSIFPAAPELDGTCLYLKSRAHTSGVLIT